MYPLRALYEAVPTDPEFSDINGLYPQPPSLKSRLTLIWRGDFFRVGSLATIFLAIMLLTIYQNRSGEDIIFHPSDRPAYLNVTVDRPLVIRLAIMFRVDGFERRQTIREAILYGIPSSDVQLEYKFFVGRGKDGKPDSQRTMKKMVHENAINNDMVVLEDIEDIPQRLSEKRFSGLKWANSVPQDQYDYAMTMDSDTFCRFQTLSRRIQHIFPSLKPRDEPILIGRMSHHSVYYENTVSDLSTNAKNEDHWFTGPVFPYPVGIGYMLSSNLTSTILSANPAIPHHIHYPYDDVMLGSWVAGLKVFHDSEITFEDRKTRASASSANSKTRHRVHPKPYLPYIVDTKIVDDIDGWHDYRHRSGAHVGRAIGWETACVHRMSPKEMSAFRARDEIKGEWDY